MRFRSFLLVLSVVANAALLAAFALRPAATTALFRDVFQPGYHASRATTTERPVASANQTVSPATAAVSAWPEFQASDLSGLVARLRGAGFPPATIRVVVSNILRERYAVRMRELLPQQNPAEYWKNPRYDLAASPKTQAALRDLGREQNKQLKDLLGEDFYRAETVDLLGARERQFGDLPLAKIEQFQKITADYNELSTKVRDDSQGILLPEDREKLALLEREQRADIERLLTPEELLQYDLRNSRAANTVRSRLGKFDVTEEEFRALYAAQQAYEDQNPPLTSPQPGIARQRMDAFDAQVQSVLGAARYAEFKQANEPTRQNTNEDVITRLVSRLNLPPTATAAVLSVQEDIQQRATAVRADRALTADQRTAQLAALATEASTKLTGTLGANGLEAYKQYGGQWLQGLTRPAPGAGGAPSGRGGVTPFPNPLD